MTKYTTCAGDTWDLIAYRLLGSCKYTELLINANRQFVDVFIFPAGVELNIPDITQEESAKVNVPPWMR